MLQFLVGKNVEQEMGGPGIIIYLFTPFREECSIQLQFPKWKRLQNLGSKEIDIQLQLFQFFTEN